MSDLEVYRILETFDRLEEANGIYQPVQRDDSWHTLLVYGTDRDGGEEEFEIEFKVDGNSIVDIDWPNETDFMPEREVYWDEADIISQIEQETGMRYAVQEGQTKVQTMGNKVKVTKDGDTTEFDDAETAKAMMGMDDDDQFTTEARRNRGEDDDGDYAYDEWKDKQLDKKADEKEEVNEEFGAYDDFNANGIPDIEEDIEWSTFDSNNPAHRKRLQSGTPVVLDPSICSDPTGDRTGVFVNRSPSGHYGTVVRNIDGKEINVHLSDIVSADITNNSIYEAYNIDFEELMNEEVTITQTTNPENPENDTTTVTAIGHEAADELAAMMANAGMNRGEYAVPVDIEEPVDTGAPVQEPGMADMIDMVDAPPVEAGPVDEPEMEAAYDGDDVSSLDYDEEILAPDDSYVEVEPEDEFSELNFEETEEPQHSNSPDELIADLDAIITGTSGGLNKPKTMHPPAAGGDNPMAVKEGESEAECPHCGWTGHTSALDGHLEDEHADDVATYNESKFVNEHEDVDNFLNLYKAFSIRGEKRS